MLTALIAGLAARTGLSQRIVARLIAALGALLLAGMAVLAWNIWLAGHDKKVVRDDRAASNLKVIQQNSAAKEKASNERAADLRAVATREEDLRDAIHSVPDTAPDPVRVRLNCERLRRAGQDTDRIPGCVGPDRGSEAGANP
jgi:hypothetical protein